MEYFKSVFIYLFAFAVTFLASFIVLILTLLGRFGVPAVEFIINSWAGMILFVSGAGLEVRGSENIGSMDRGVIFVANHLSLLDIPAAVKAIPGKVRFMAKKSLFKIPVFGQAMRSAGIIEIDRNHREKAISAINSSDKYLRQGYVYVVFPEGTRSADNTVRPFKKGPIVFGINHNIPIVPMAITGTFDILPKTRFTIRSGRIIIEFSNAVDTSKYEFEDRDKLKEELNEIVSSIHKKNLEELSDE